MATPGTLENLIGRLSALTTGKMRAILSAHNIINRSGRLSQSCNIKITLDTNGAYVITSTTPPNYAKYIDNGLYSHGYRQWTTQSGKPSKIPTHYTAPLIALGQGIARQVGPVIAKDIVSMIEAMKKEFKNVT